MNIRERLARLVKNDFRASFIDVFALLVKCATNFSNLPSSQLRYLLHCMDFLKVVGTHWFVMDISKGTLKSSGSENHNYDDNQVTRLSNLNLSQTYGKKLSYPISPDVFGQMSGYSNDVLGNSMQTAVSSYSPYNNLQEALSPNNNTGYGNLNVGKFAVPPNVNTFANSYGNLSGSNRS
ncbi:hypothetical protein HK096_006562 [Nowakowskiella sp. JEL0078]|nr:hypothetical protein HK096_006562 [Nowakowskiella sp. JEL0078]